MHSLVVAIGWGKMFGLRNLTGVIGSATTTPPWNLVKTQPKKWMYNMFFSSLRCVTATFCRWIEGSARKKTHDSNLQPANVVICQSEVGVSNEVKVSRYARRFVLDNLPLSSWGFSWNVITHYLVACLMNDSWGVCWPVHLFLLHSQIWAELQVKHRASALRHVMMFMQSCKICWLVDMWEHHDMICTSSFEMRPLKVFERMLVHSGQPQTCRVNKG